MRKPDTLVKLRYVGWKEAEELTPQTGYRITIGFTKKPITNFHKEVNHNWLHESFKSLRPRNLKVLTDIVSAIRHCKGFKDEKRERRNSRQTEREREDLP